MFTTADRGNALNEAVAAIAFAAGLSRNRRAGFRPLKSTANERGSVTESSLHGFCYWHGRACNQCKVSRPGPRVVPGSQAMVLLEMSITPLGKGESVGAYVAECVD